MSTAEDINKKVAEAFDTQLKDVENEIAKQYGAISSQSEIQIDPFLDVKNGASAVNEITDDSTPEIIQTQTELPPPPPLIDMNVNRTKKELIDTVLELQDKLKIENPQPESQLKKLRKIELEKRLAELADSGLKKAQQEMIQAAVTPGGIAEQLFVMNVALCSLSETISGRFKEQTGDVNILEGWREKVIQQKEDFLPILQRIYTDHKPVIDRYVSPVSQWGFIMLSTATSTVIDNTRKKK